MQPPDFVDVQTDFVRVTCRHFEAVGSTNSEAMAWLKSAEPGSWFACSAAHQTAGRGRLGREWTDVAGEDVLLSVGHRWRQSPGPERLAELNLGVAVVVREALAALLSPQDAAELRIKWPNDLFAGERKLAGLLLETSWRGADWGGWVLGIGLNGGRRGGSGPAGWGDAGGTEGAEVLRTRIVRAVVDAVEAWERGGWDGPEAAVARFDAVAFGAGEMREFEVEGRTWSGKFLGVETDGRGRFAWVPDGDGMRPPELCGWGEVVWRLN
jgi:BirA family biotin operon repressor/biotin-[acetyl-CoA-carboxylase] ligase